MRIPVIVTKEFNYEDSYTSIRRAVFSGKPGDKFMVLCSINKSDRDKMREFARDAAKWWDKAVSIGNKKSGLVITIR